MAIWPCHQVSSSTSPKGGKEPPEWSCNAQRLRERRIRAKQLTHGAHDQPAERIPAHRGHDGARVPQRFTARQDLASPAGPSGLVATWK